ncbi:MAG: CusA/CzcA family heavy metal efflux RND transporter [Proteobacteria bacterium]|nr:CusA/CzcA family heavy metal efflux RND transporter [Cystobacterineae bacterium]MCL2258447.1 CusA/CzcA family heavy metal efflux RND transporter [Cystobacterineae bacterium]MCL2315214.1 CusA/CzcA family heavy metal efflux RND transporter [Pseudomonadota bacterium]
MKKLVEACLKWRLLVFAFVLLIAFVGARSALHLPIDAVPDITNVQVQVLTQASSLGPVDVERTITFPIESSMSGLPGVTNIRSISRFGLSAVTVIFEEGMDLLRARQLISERLIQVRDMLPPGISPELGPLSSGLGEIFQFEVRSRHMCSHEKPCHSPMELRSLLDWFIAYELRSVPGVVEVNSFGGELKTYEVEVLPERLRALNLSLNHLFEALEKNNATAGGGYLIRSGEQLLVRGEGRIQHLDEIGDVLVETRDDGVPVRVRDVARVQTAPLIRHGAVTRDGRGEVVTGIVMMLVGANGRKVVEDVKAKVAELSPSLPEGVYIETFYDRAELVDKTIRTVAENLTLGALFVIAVLLFLLGSIRGGLIVAAAIPFSMLVAVSAMHMLGLSGNLMSLGAIDFGIVVDGTIIVVENAVVHLAAATRNKQRPMSYREASEVVLGSTLDVQKAALFGGAIIILVYVPILTLEGIEGKMFKPMALVVIFALLGAFTAALTFVPALVATFLRKNVREKELPIVRMLHRVYPRMLSPLMKHPKKVMLVSLLLLLTAGLVASRMGAEFIPNLDEGAIAVQISRLPSVSLEESILGATRFEKILLEFPEVTTVVSKTGRPEIATDPMGVELSDVIIMLRPPSEWKTTNSKETLIQKMSQRLSEALPGLGFSFSQPIQLRMSELINSSRSDVAITIFGDDLATLERLSLQVQNVLRNVPGATDIRGEQLTGLSTLEVTVDRASASRYGISVRDALDAIEALGGRKVGEVYEGERRFTLQVRVPYSLRNDFEQIRSLPVSGNNGPLVPLAQIANIQVVDSPASISREQVRRRTNVEVNVRQVALSSFVANAQEAIAHQIQLPPGYTMRWGGQFENLSAAYERLVIAVPLALGLILVLLYMAFGSLKSAALIYLNVPFAAVGGVFLLAMRQMHFSISAAVGFIALFGISVLNGVVLVMTVNKLKKAGKPPHQAAFEGAISRLRPVVMTASVAALGFIPMALSTNPGAEVQRPLATVVIGGLVSATFLTLFVLPTLYAFVYRKTPLPPP